MELADLLPRERIRIPLQADSLEAGVRILLETLELGPHAPEEAARILARLRFRDGGFMFSPSPEVWIGVVRTSTAGGGAALGIAAEGLPSYQRLLSDQSGSPRILLLIRSGPRFRLSASAVEALGAVLSAPDALAGFMGARDAEEVRSLVTVLRAPISERLLVRDALPPRVFTVSADAPLSEVVDCLARNGLSTVGVVGGNFQFMGVITSADALRHSLQGGLSHEVQSEVTARDVMSRAVLCLSEDQGLEEAALAMVNREAAQLPVIREGELVGFLTRESLLRVLYSSEGMD
jgi:CBS domain-containing protein